MRLHASPRSVAASAATTLPLPFPSAAGNTCYANAVLQCLVRVPELREYASKWETDTAVR